MKQIMLNAEVVSLTTEDLTYDFTPICLEEIEDVKLLNRFDSKFCLNVSTLANIMKSIQNDYYVLEVNGVSIQKYRSVYFDTPENRFYLDHHNGLAKRFKIRKREYSDSGLAYLEIKQKNNKGKTSKKRLAINRFSSMLSVRELQYIKENTPLKKDKLIATFSNQFKRITLISKNFNERCTIDMDIKFNALFSGESIVEDLVVVELKQAEANLKSKFSEKLRQNKIYQCSFSKYCMGRALNDKTLKANRFKPGMLDIKKKYKYQEVW